MGSVGEKRHLNHDLDAKPVSPSPNPPRSTGQSCSAAAVLLLLPWTQGEVWGITYVGSRGTDLTSKRAVYDWEENIQTA